MRNNQSVRSSVMLIHMYYDGKRARKFIGVVEKQKPVLEIILHWKGLTQGYSTHGGSGRWALACAY